MGVVVEVRSILTPEAERRPKTDSRHIVHVMEQTLLDRICEIFTWSKAPWQEPFAIDGAVDTSIGNGRYSVLLSLAWALKDIENYPEFEIHSLIETVEQTLRSPSEHQYEQLRNNCKHFPHTLDRNIYNSWYLPIEFEYPIHTEITLDYAVEYSLASSVKAAIELDFLSQVTSQIVAIRGADFRVPSYDNHTWGGVHDACMMILKAAKESIKFNLPFLIAW